jgi:hypothetical protein
LPQAQANKASRNDNESPAKEAANDDDDDPPPPPPPANVLVDLTGGPSLSDPPMPFPYPSAVPQLPAGGMSGVAIGHYCAGLETQVGAQQQEINRLYQEIVALRQENAQLKEPTADAIRAMPKYLELREHTQHIETELLAYRTFVDSIHTGKELLDSCAVVKMGLKLKYVRSDADAASDE